MSKSTYDDAVFSEVELDEPEISPSRKPSANGSTEVDAKPYVPADYSELTTYDVVESTCGCRTNRDGETTKCQRCQQTETATLRVDILNHEVNGLCNHVAQLHSMLLAQSRALMKMELLIKDLADGRLEIKPAPDVTSATLNERWTLPEAEK